MRTMSLSDFDASVSLRPSVTRADIVGREDIDPLLHDFYPRARRPDARPVFVDVARMNLEQHLGVIGAF